jgi:hypothetical protein
MLQVDVEIIYFLPRFVLFLCYWLPGTRAELNLRTRSLLAGSARESSWQVPTHLSRRGGTGNRIFS